jgi:hypothetical protein
VEGHFSCIWKHTKIRFPVCLIPVRHHVSGRHTTTYPISYRNTVTPQESSPSPFCPVCLGKTPPSTMTQATDDYCVRPSARCRRRLGQALSRKFSVCVRLLISWRRSVGKRSAPGSTPLLGSFRLFARLPPDVQTHILSFVAVAPWETLLGSSAIAHSKRLQISESVATGSSTLTNVLPFVSRTFRSYCNSNVFWEAALQRAIYNSPVWRVAVQRLFDNQEGNVDSNQKSQYHDKWGTGTNTRMNDRDEWTNSSRRKRINKYQNTCRALHFLQDLSQNDLSSVVQDSANQDSNPNPISLILYKDILQQSIRVCCRVVISRMTTSWNRYELVLSEPRYRTMMSQLLEESNKRHGSMPKVPKPVYFLQATAGTLASVQRPCDVKAHLVQILHYSVASENEPVWSTLSFSATPPLKVLLRKSIIHVVVQRVADVRMERYWVQPQTKGLYQAQALRIREHHICQSSG